MKLLIDRKTLLDAAKLAATVASRTSHTPALTGVRIVAAERVTLSATDLDTTVEITVGAEVADPGELVVPADLFARFLASCSDDTVTLTSGDDDLSVTCGTATGTILALDGDTWPKLPDVEGDTFTLEPERHQLIGRILFAASTDQTRSPALCGVHLHGGQATCTDSYRLARARLGDGVDLPEVVLPAAPLRRALRDADGPLEVTINENRVRLATRDGICWTLRVIAEEYPLVDRIIPNPPPPRHLTMARGPLSDAVDRAEVIAELTDAKRRFVVLERHDEVLTVQSRAVDVGEIVDEIACTGDFEGPVQLNGVFFGQLLDAYAGDEATLHLADGLKPVVADDGDIYQLLMPVRIS